MIPANIEFSIGEGMKILTPLLSTLLKYTPISTLSL